MSPEEGAIVGSRPVFHLGYEGSGELRPRGMRFRITLDPAGPDGEAYVFDQRRRHSGWASAGDGLVLYRPRKPLEHGRYRWRVGFWDGVEWIENAGSRGIRVDSVPPADVEGLSVLLDAERGEVRLEWKPVALDRDGRPEFVARYHVYRYERRAFPRGIKALEVGVVVEPRFVDRDPPHNESRILYYRVTAEDQAGNEPDRRD